MNIGFWNIESKVKKPSKAKKKTNVIKDLSDYLAEWTVENELDIICLAETRDDIILSFIIKLNAISKSNYSQIKCAKDKLILISRYSDTVFEDKSGLYDSTRWTAHKITIPSIIELNLFAVHFHSKASWPEASLSLECVNFARDIKLIEKSTNTNLTVLIGDFNMNPFENGLVAANGINALSDLDYTAKSKKGRKVNSTYYDFFYNPMWNFFGDLNKHYGTYYYRTPGHVSQEWNMYDQVIIRPTLKPYLNKPFVKIIKKIGTENLIKAYGRPDKDKYSDHLPIVFSLKL